MKHLLLDVNVVVDLSVQRSGTANAEIALSLAEYAGISIWVYAGSVQTLEYVTASELRALLANTGITLSRTESQRRAKELLGAVTANYSWLAALAGEGPVFASEDPEDEQLIRALDRFPADSAILLTRDKPMLQRAAGRAMTPEAFIERWRQTLAGPREIDFIDLNTQQETCRSALEQNIHRVLHHGQYIMGPEIAELEAALAEYVGVKYCLTVASGTDSLEIALRALGIGPGDEVITVPFTWISSAEVIRLVGATPVFVDIEPDSFNIDIDRIESAITPRTKAILPVSLFGQMPDYAAINAIAARHGLTVIEDGAQSFGATQRGRRSGGVTTIASTSFFPAKPLGCYGDGGALFTDDEALAETIRAIRTHGGTRRHHHPLLGMNGRFDTLQAAILRAKLPRFEDEVRARQRIGARYSELLQQVCIIPKVRPGNTHVYAQYTLRVVQRERVIEALKSEGIPTAVYYPKCLHEQPVFADLGYCPGDFPESERASREVLSLPMHPFLQEQEQDRAAKCLVKHTEQTR